MITVKCPVRISLIGGSSDLDSYIKKYNKGSVISFTPDLYTYVSVYKDKIGKNNLEKKYIVNYSKREETNIIENIKNELVKEYFISENISPCSIHMTSDIFSYGSGLASSSSYSCGLVYAIEELHNNTLSNIECGIKAHNLEKKINPLLGLQDVFGCCIGGFKKIDFIPDKLPKYTFLPTKIFDLYNICLVYTGYTRNSTEVLKGVSVPETDTFNPLVERAEEYLMTEDYVSFLNIINEGWNEKKRTSKYVLENNNLHELDIELSNMKGCVANKLCGAGNGGFFLCFFEKDIELPNSYYKINLTSEGVTRVL